MSRYRDRSVDQPLLLPPSVSEFVPEGHLCLLARELARNVLDLSSIQRTYSKDPRGYRLRKQVVEPVFGHIKECRGFRRFLLRGLSQVQAEWALICTAHNLLKLAAARA